MGLKRKNKKMSGFKKFTLIYTLILCVFGVYALVYVNNALIDYEKGDIDNYLKTLLSDIKNSAKKNNIEKYLKLSNIDSDYEEKSDLVKGYKELLTTSKLSYKETDEKNIFDLYAGNKLFATVSLDDSIVEHKLGLLTYNKWNIKNITSYNENGLYSYDIYLSNDYSLFINGEEAREDDLEENTPIEEYKEVALLVTMPTIKHYTISGLTIKPDIKILDKDGNIVNYKIDENNKINVNSFYKTDNINDAMNRLDNNIDPLEFAKVWSLFLTAEYDNEAGKGLYRLTPNLIEGTQMYTKAYNWATQVDIAFTSIHQLEKEIFTNEKTSNFTVYNENAFSVEVYLEKNMIVNAQKKVDILHEMIYFVYYDGAYRVINMKSVA